MRRNLRRPVPLLALGIALTAMLAAACGAGVHSDAASDGSDGGDVSDRPDAPTGLPGDGGDSGDAAPMLDAVTPDAEPVRSTVYAVAGSPGGPAESLNGANAALDLRTLTVTPGMDATAARYDPVMRRIGDKFYILNRGASPHISVVNSTLFKIGLVSDPLAASPQDIAIVGTKMFVPSLGGVGVAVLAPGALGRAIDLSDLDVDGHPDCMSIYKVDTRLYVACAVLDQNGTPRGPGKVVVLDAATEERVATLTLSTARPYSLFEQLPNGDLVISTVPNLVGSGSGCVERVITSALPSASGCMISNASLGGGYASTLAVQASPPMLYLAVSFFPASTLRAYDLATGQLRAAPVTPASQRVADVVACPDGEVVIADTATAASGLRVYGSDGIERTTESLSIGRTPTSRHGLACY